MQNAGPDSTPAAGARLHGGRGAAGGKEETRAEEKDGEVREEALFADGRVDAAALRKWAWTPPARRTFSDWAWGEKEEEEEEQEQEEEEEEERGSPKSVRRQVHRRSLRRGTASEKATETRKRKRKRRRCSFPSLR